jgi:hypothetical protein
MVIAVMNEYSSFASSPPTMACAAPPWNATSEPAASAAATASAL